MAIVLCSSDNYEDIHIYGDERTFLSDLRSAVNGEKFQQKSESLHERRSKCGSPAHAGCAVLMMEVMRYKIAVGAVSLCEEQGCAGERIPVGFSCGETTAKTNDSDNRRT